MIVEDLVRRVLRTSRKPAPVGKRSAERPPSSHSDDPELMNAKDGEKHCVATL